MEDSSSVRAKVAQYFVNKKHQELKSNGAMLKIDDLTLLQAIPENGVDELAHGVDERAHGANELRKLPPFFPSTPGDGNVSWEQVLNDYRAHRPREERRFPGPPPWYCVAIIGAGVAGLRTAMLLQRMGIPYKIFEASDRPGGRVFTYQFASKPPKNPQGKHDYYDIGAMRFPNNSANKETFDLFEELGLNKIEYVMSIGENIRHFNSEC
jgi:Flavin containing amine oxidoreductase